MQALCQWGHQGQVLATNGNARHFVVEDRPLHPDGSELGAPFSLQLDGYQPRYLSLCGNNHHLRVPVDGRARGHSRWTLSRPQCGCLDSVECQTTVSSHNQQGNALSKTLLSQLAHSLHFDTIGRVCCCGGCIGL